MRLTHSRRHLEGAISAVVIERTGAAVSRTLVDTCASVATGLTVARLVSCNTKQDGCCQNKLLHTKDVACCSGVRRSAGASERNLCTSHHSCACSTVQTRIVRQAGIRLNFAPNAGIAIKALTAECKLSGAGLDRGAHAVV